MGDFVLYKRSAVDENKHNAIIETLAAQGSINPRIIQDDSYTILSFEKINSPVVNFAEHNNGDYCLSSGCFFYKGLNGKNALDLFLNDFVPEHYSPHSFMGIFTLIIKKAGRLFVVTDPMGASRIFHSDDQTIWSSSFLALAENMSGLSIDPQGVYEYCFQEANYGNTTPINQIKMADSLSYFELCKDGIKAKPKNLPINFELSTKPYDDLIEEHSALLQTQMQDVVSSYGEKIATALSGGYDSRLMLSLAKSTGINPNVYVYGPDGSPDVTVARDIAADEGFEINHINKAKFPKPSPEAYADIVKDNYYALDGFPNESIFDFGANMATRRERSKNGTLVLNGGGGEIYRNFFYLPNHSYNVDDLLDVFYTRYSTEFCTTEFVEQTYRENLKTKIINALELDSDHLTRTQLEYAYPAFRLRYWTAKDNSNNNRLGSFLTPFICYETIMATLKIPLKYKTHGKFQGDLINQINPAMASYLSDYGYRFNEPVPFSKKLKNNMTIYRPAWLRRRSYAIQYKMAKLTVPETLADNYLRPILPDTQYMDQYFKMDAIRDAALLGRVLTLEYLFSRIAV
ncbi:MAG: hypothetical protein JKY84_03715 [Emcibacteraceae bacterium]|nr:hypothetical protein [Emcibacteraceae bacterium]